MSPTDPPLLSFLFCADVAELIFGWTAKYWQSRIFIYQILFSKVFPSFFSYCFSPMLYRAAGWCPQQTPDIWQAGCFSSFMFFPMFSLSSFSKNFPWCFSYCFFPQCCIGQLVGVLSRPQIYGKLARPAGTRHKHPIRIHPTPLRIHLHSCNENENKIKFRNFSHNAEQRTCKIPIQSGNYHELLHITKVS